MKWRRIGPLALVILALVGVWRWRAPRVIVISDVRLEIGSDYVEVTNHAGYLLAAPNRPGAILLNEDAMTRREQGRLDRMSYGIADLSFIPDGCSLRVPTEGAGSATHLEFNKGFVTDDVSALCRKVNGVVLDIPLTKL